MFSCLVLCPGVVDSFSLTALPGPVDPRPPVVRVRAALAYTSRR